MMFVIWGNLNASWIFCSVKIDTPAWAVAYVESVYEKDATSKVSNEINVSVIWEVTLRCQILVITQCSLQTQTYAGQLAAKNISNAKLPLRYHQHIIQLAFKRNKSVPSQNFYKCFDVGAWCHLI